MTDLPPIEYLDEAARLHGYQSWDEASRCAGVFIRQAIIAHAHALHQLAQARAEIAALKPRETLEDVARIMGDELGRVHLSPDQAIRLLCLAYLLRSGELSLRANDSDDARAACELIDDIAQEIALQVSHQKDHPDE